ncbi:HAMP domain-containing protein [Cohnella sp. CFH 77786]|uniref:sensor histidine kinase n=1 Tax=Cohnella sp. CFH 77786 TaxID=2662265 RepID=UPI001C60A812|nr:sensor histidine kinase [Cohnella sp. CFH 77786]MBW5448554.1 HAMP domain-containing protein [Cohnella sp. CFH 77786]
MKLPTRFRLRLPNRRLHHQFIALIFFCMLIPVVAVGSVHFAITSNLFSAQLEESSETLLSQTAGQLDQMYRDFKTVERQFLQDEKFISIFAGGDPSVAVQVVNAAFLSDGIAKAGYVNPSFQISVLAVHPHYLSAFGLPVHSDAAALEDVKRRAGKALKRFFLTGDVQGRQSFRWMAPFGNVLTGELYGCLEIRVPYAVMSRLLDEMAASGQTQMLLLDPDGRESVRQSAPPIRPDANMIAEILAAGRSPLRPASHPELSAFKRTIGDEWVLAGIIPREHILSPLHRVQRWTIGIVLAQVALTLLLAISLAKSFSRPIRRLALLVARKKSEGADIVIPKVERSDEIRSLYDGIRDLLQEIRQEQIQKKEYQLRMLQYQINPHFLYNSLDSIQWKAIEHKDKDLTAMITSLSFFLRHGLNQADVVAVREELGHLNSYLLLQRIRYRDQFSVDIRVDDELLGQQIPKLSLQPLVENAIRHGMNRLSGGSRIEIRGERVSEERFALSVLDDGRNLDLQKVIQLLRFPERDSSSFGIRNVHERTKLYFGESYGLSARKTEEGGTRFDLELPYRQSDIKDG